MRYGQIVLTVEWITPEVAKRIIEHDNIDNRRIRPKVVQQYARDMERGVWHRKPVAICFDREGKLGNGQHTLSAIIESGIAQELLVAKNVPREAIAAMDIGLRRSITDVSKFIGMEIRSREAAVARVMEFGPDDTSPRSFEELFDAFLMHEESIRFACENAAKCAGLNSTTLAVVASAWHSEDRDKLLRFMDIMKTGVSVRPEDRTVITFRDFCRTLRGNGNADVKKEVWRKAKSALLAFLDGQVLSKIYGRDNVRFDLKNTPPRPAPQASQVERSRTARPRADAPGP